MIFTLLYLKTDLKIILLDYQNNYVRISSMNNAARNVLAINLSVLYNYFNDLTKLFNLYLNF